MPQMADTVPHSVRMRSIWGPKAWKYQSIAMPPFTNDEVVPDRTWAAFGAHFRAHARQPGLVQEACGVGDQFVVFLALHEGRLLGRFAILERDVRSYVDAGHAVVAQTDRLGQAGPHVDHVGNRGIPIEIMAAADDRLEALR